MYIKNDIIYFKSDEPYYIKEKSGIKKNTVRFISDEEHDIILDVIDNLKYISIHKFNEQFIRELTDISIIKKNIDDYRIEYYLIYIFSWA
jgi:hypothetical protein